MGKLSDWIKNNAKEGADISEAEKLIELTSIEGIDTKEKAIDFIGKNEVFRNGVNRLKTTAIEDHDKKFQTEKLPTLIKAEREKIQKELNPEMTPIEKELAEQKEWRAKQELKELRYETEKSLRAKATELKYPVDRAERFAVYGENALQMLEDDSKFLSEQVKSQLETEIKTRFGDTPPPEQNKGNPEKQVDRKTWDSFSAEKQSSFIAEQGVVVD